MRLVFSILGLPLALVAVVFAVANRQTAVIDLWPFPLTAEVPVYLAVLGALFLGMVLGGTTAWLAGGRARAQGRAARRDAARLHREVDSLRQAQAAAVPTPLEASPPMGPGAA